MVFRSVGRVAAVALLILTPQSAADAPNSTSTCCALMGGHFSGTFTMHRTLAEQANLTLEFDPASGAFARGHLATLGVQNITAFSCARISATLFNVSLTLVPGLDGLKPLVVPIADAFYRTDLRGGKHAGKSQ